MSRQQLAWAVMFAVLPVLLGYWTWGPWALLAGFLLASAYLLGTSAWLRTKMRVRTDHAPAPSAATLQPASVEELHAHAQQAIWGDDRYRAESTWNDGERQAFLHLYFRDEVAGQGYRVSVFDPAGVRSEVRAAQFAGRGSITELYPTTFRDTPPVISGDYTVVWYALVSREGSPSLEEVARDTFVVPRFGHTLH